MTESRSTATRSLEASQVLDAYFIENRAKLLDLAAFMDRFDRGTGVSTSSEDPRWRAVTAAIAILGDARPERARRMLELWSDPTLEPIPKANVKGATGTWSGRVGT